VPEFKVIDQFNKTRYITADYFTSADRVSKFWRKKSEFANELVATLTDTMEVTQPPDRAYVGRDPWFYALSQPKPKAVVRNVFDIEASAYPNATRSDIKRLLDQFLVSHCYHQVSLSQEIIYK